MTEDNQLIDLTRRRLLAGVGAVGLASATAGLGTSALFSDHESFDGNTVTAGTLDLLVHYEATYDGAPAENLAPNPDGVVDGEPGLFYTLDDVKPGDTGWFQFCFELNTNPSYLWVCTAQTADDENGQNEPELDDEILVDVYYAEDDGTPIAGGELASGVTLAGALAAFENGRALNFDAVDENPGDQTPYPPSSEPGELTGPCIRLDWELPAAVGNEVQSDSLAFAVDFHAIQARNTDGTDNPCGDGTTDGNGDSGGDGNGDATQDPPSTDFEDEQDEGWQLIGDATTGEAQVVASGGNPGAYLEGDDTVSGGVWYFDAPSSFLGDQSAFAGGALAYDLQQSPRSSQFVADDFVLEGASTSLHYRYDSTAAYPAETPAWSEYSVPLDTTAGWTVGSASGPAATPTEIAAVPGDLTSLRIRGEFRSGSDTDGLDNPRFVAP